MSRVFPYGVQIDYVLYVTNVYEDSKAKEISPERGWIRMIDKKLKLKILTPFEGNNAKVNINNFES